MRIRSKAAIGGTLVSAATVGGLFVAGVFTTAALVVTDPLARPASADSLTPFDSCRDLLDWYVEHGVDEVGPWGWEDPMLYATDLAEPLVASAADGAAERSSSGTGTNTQEVDVDEPDVAKTDGRRVVRIVDQRIVVVSDVTGAEPRELGRISLPVDAYGGELLLVGDHVLVSQPGGARGGPMPLEDTASSDMAGPAGGTRIIDVDISDPASPRITDDHTYTGRQVSMRLYDDTVRLVTTTTRPDLAWARPGERRGKGLSEAEATRRNRDLVRATTIEDWLPAVVDNRTKSRAALLDCPDVYRPTAWSGGETTTVTTYDVRTPNARRSVAVAADGHVVYSSTDRLYVASSRAATPSVWRRMYGSVADREIGPGPADVRTQLHAFALDGTDTSYVGSGHVSGSVRDRWSLDEHDGKLRVAWTTSSRRGRTQNGITVLSERDGALVPTGSIGRLGVDESIQSVRWFDDLAVLVTFRQVDPLYTIDLADQDRPRELGKLKIPGYSGYLHPIGDDLLLGLGVDATMQGENLGAQAAVFDIADLTDPRRVSQQGFGHETSMQALDDPRGFTWLPERRTGLTSVSSWSSDRSRLVALSVGDGGSLLARDLATDVGWNARTLPLADGRVALVDEDLRVLDLG